MILHQKPINFESHVKALPSQSANAVNGSSGWILPASSLSLPISQHSKGSTTKSRSSHDLGNTNNLSTEPKEKIEKAKSY